LDIVLYQVGIFNSYTVFNVNEDIETKEVSIHGFMAPDKGMCWLLDTPGFDDTFVPDAEVLRMVAGTLTELASREVRLSLLYLHRILDVRVGHTAIKNLELLRLICGDQAMKNVTIVSTFWDVCGADDPDSVKKEETLIQGEKYWGVMIRNGARVCRHTGTRESAWNVVEPLLHREPTGRLQIQKELAEESKSLGDTAAGQYLLEDSEKLKAQQERQLQDLQGEMEQAVQERDRAYVEELRKERERIEKRFETLFEQRERLGVRLEELQEQASKMVSKGSGEED
jgi:hypothetical protein